MVIHNRIPTGDWASGEGDEGARCRNFPIEKDPETGLITEDAWFRDAENALPVCNGDFIGTPCPVRGSCLFRSLVNNDQHGVWGGMTTPQRRWIRRNVPRVRWDDDRHLRKVTPPPDYFKDLGNEEDEEDESQAEDAQD